MLEQSIVINFFMRGHGQQFAIRRTYHVPCVGDICIFNGVRFTVHRIEYCFDEDATEKGLRINIDLLTE